MNKRLTDDYGFIKRIDPLAAEVFKDKKYYYLSNIEISKYRKISIDDVKNAISTYKCLLKDKDNAWLSGLSNRAKAAIIKNRYTEFKELYNDVMSEKVDIESYSGVGHKVALEIRRWCIVHS